MTITCTRGARHEYHADGIDLFSVSQIRKVAHDPYLGLNADILEFARVRGAMLHRRFWKLLASRAGLLDRPATIKGFEGYCTSMDAWVERHDVMPVKIEETSCSLKFGFAGTPDALVRYGPKAKLLLMDLKTGAVNKTDPMQLLAYKQMDGYEEAEGLLDVYIQADGGRAVEQPVTPGVKVAQWSWFLNAMGVLQSRINHGVTT